MGECASTLIDGYNRQKCPSAMRYVRETDDRLGNSRFRGRNVLLPGMRSRSEDELPQREVLVPFTVN